MSADSANPILNYERLDQIAQQRAAEFASADPYPHIVIDDFLPQIWADKALEEFPPPDAPLEWRKHHVTTDQGQTAQANKLGFSDERQLGPTLRQLFWELNSALCLQFLEKLTAIPDLIPDPHLLGGGIHQSLPGAVLAIHADFSRHARFHLQRRLNLLIFLNRDWQDEWAGHLELWDRQMTRCEQKISPILNRCVIFQTDRQAFHGHPEVLTCPPDRTRKSLALYYYSNNSPPPDVDDGQATSWQQRPLDRSAMPSWTDKLVHGVRHPLQTVRRLLSRNKT